MLFALERRALALPVLSILPSNPQDPPSTESSQASCAREEISPEVMVPEERASTERSKHDAHINNVLGSLMRTSP